MEQGRRIAILRSAMGLSQAQLSVKIGMRQSAISKIETGQRKLSADEAREILSQTPGICVLDEPDKSGYPVPLDVSGQDPVFVGRIREDRSVEHGLDMWVVSDNIRKGAALNAVQIAETMIEMGLI